MPTSDMSFTGFDRDGISNFARGLKLMGAQIAFKRPGEDAQQLCWGRRNTDGDPVTDKTLFTVGSVGKLLTSLTAAQACETGLCDLDGAIGDIHEVFKIPLARNRRRYPPVTLRQLLSHAAGARDPTAKADPLSIQAAAADIGRRGLIFVPGRMPSWSNGGFMLAGGVLELLANARFEDLIRAAVVGPLKLMDTAITTAEALNRQVANRPANRSFDWMSRRWYVPAGAHFSTASDLARIAEVLCIAGQGKSAPMVISDTMRAELLRPTVGGLSGFSAAYSFCPAGRLSEFGILFINGITEHGGADVRANIDTGEILVGCSQSPAIGALLNEFFPDFATPTMRACDFTRENDDDLRAPIAAYQGMYAGMPYNVTVEASGPDRMTITQWHRSTGARIQTCTVERTGETLFLRPVAVGSVEPVRFTGSCADFDTDILHFDGYAYSRAA